MKLRKDLSPPSRSHDLAPAVWMLNTGGHIAVQPRSQGLFPSLGKGPGNEVDSSFFRKCKIPFKNEKLLFLL